MGQKNEWLHKKSKTDSLDAKYTESGLAQYPVWELTRDAESSPTDSASNLLLTSWRSEQAANFTAFAKKFPLAKQDFSWFRKNLV